MDGSTAIPASLVGEVARIEFVSILRDVFVDIDILARFSDTFSALSNMPEEALSRFMLARWTIRSLSMHVSAG